MWRLQKPVKSSMKWFVPLLSVRYKNTETVKSVMVLTPAREECVWLRQHLKASIHPVVRLLLELNVANWWNLTHWHCLFSVIVTSCDPLRLDKKCLLTVTFLSSLHRWTMGGSVWTTTGTDRRLSAEVSGHRGAGRSNRTPCLWIRFSTGTWLCLFYSSFIGWDQFTMSNCISHVLVS